MRSNFDVMFLLAIFTLPSSLLVSELSHAAGTYLNFSLSVRNVIDFIGFLLFGIIQFFLIGYIVGVISGYTKRVIGAWWYRR